MQVLIGQRDAGRSRRRRNAALAVSLSTHMAASSLHTSRGHATDAPNQVRTGTGDAHELRSTSAQAIERAGLFHLSSVS